MYRALPLFLLPVMVCAQAVDPRPYIASLEKNLTENIIAFWYPKSVDRANGGFHMHWGAKGERKEGTKALVVQARMVWLSARLARAGYRKQEMLEAAEHGYRFLRDKMWDAENGGFYWEVDASGDKKLRNHKHLYGQAFALYAVSEYAQASGRRDVRDFAIRIYDVLEEKAHDGEFGGYREFFSRDWKSPEAGERPYMSVPADMKLMNTHLHLMEAVSTFYRATKHAPALARLTELMNIESNAVVRKGVTACTDKYDRNWKPRLDGEWARVSYGHDLENIWLLVEAAESAGVSPYPMMDLFRENFAHSMKYGWDAGAGGFYDSGPLLKEADRRAKVWWVQAEALVSALTMYKLTRERAYFDVFAKTLDFVNSRLTDWSTGEWHGQIDAEGRAVGDKGHNWKAGYHNGRAMIECLALLRSLQ
ncbi:MAG: AGE family epimerase/isomerase [Bryobacteraceae bacterium]|nr:AGE family epimerase/isomerase [Bryobacteraceae bacterium]